ncbi:hypothetical protein FNV43_RR18410 [Rhamnella rubrinervis]|uniref:Protein kinase domain-containing protein n=1 Tax=Rhamnella rubrinervis TaxID=2594499 RepID=A0A8K0DYZ2_9ROSA|nr:hypothetical protein FNV43_RR18410 [Rhamnella rubrinervis]
MAMESFSSPSYVVMAYDATKECSEMEFSFAVKNIRTRGDILRRGNTLVVLGVLHLLSHPLGYRAKASPGLFQMTTRAVEEEISKKADLYVENLQKTAETCIDDGVSIEVKIIAGSPIKQVILQEVMACNAAWLILDRKLKRDMKFYLNKIPCKIVCIRDIFSVEVMKSFCRSSTTGTNFIQNKFICSICKSVPITQNSQVSEDENEDEDDDQLLFSCESYPFSVDSLEDPDALNTSFKPISSHIDTPFHYKEAAYDATRDREANELEVTIDRVRMRGDILRGGDILVVLGVLHTVPHPLGYPAKACPDFFGTSNRAMEEEVSKKVDMYIQMLLQTAERCENEGVSIEVKVIAGFPINKVILQEVMSCNAAWVILDRHLQRDMRFYLKHIPCKVALIQDGFSVAVSKSDFTSDQEVVEHKFVCALSKPVPAFSSLSNYNNEQSVFNCQNFSFSYSSLETSGMLKSNLTNSSTFRSQDFNSLKDAQPFPKQEKLGMSTKGDNMISTSSRMVSNQSKNVFRHRSSEAPFLCITCGTRTVMYIKDSMILNYSEIQLATNDFSRENLLGEGGYGHVYKGELKDGQLIAAKVRKEASNQGFTEFQSEVYVLSFARHKNIVMLLGYCCRENLNILVYEYICNKSLDWHLFDKKATVLEWHQRYAIAIGTAKGLRFLHEECRGGPIIHRDMRPSNILLTHDCVPMLGDFGLAKWRTSDELLQTRILGTLGYLAPEYAENGIISVRTDVYAFGIVLLQLISGRKVIDDKKEEQQQSIRQWAEPIIRRLALHELIDPRIGESYDTYELYIMAKAAYSCMQRSPEMRPSIGEIVRLLEGENDHFHHFENQLLP